MTTPPSVPRPRPSGDAHRTVPAADPVLVDCVVRSDAPWKPGGDTVQVREYARHLAGRGVDLREVPFSPSLGLRPGAVVHVFNIDRPFEFVLASRAARGHRVVVSPIHHEIGRVRAMRAADRGRGLVSIAGTVLPESVREWLATAVRAWRGAASPSERVRAARAAVRTLSMVSAVWRTAGHELDRAAAVALLAEGEGRHLRHLTGWRAENDVLVPNGRPDDLDLEHRRPWSERPAGSIVIIGRIEPRKRQLEVARAADALGIPITVVGPLADEGSGYAAAFSRLAARSAAVTHVGALNRTEVLRLLGGSRVLLNASWVEVQSLVDLEAATMGCAVVTTRTGHSAEWLGSAVVQVDGDDPAVLLRSAAALAAPQTLPPVAAEYDRTWEQASSDLLRIYLSA